jgi:iron complex outermembrane recepter protein
MLKKTKLCTGLMVACGGVLLCAGPAALAQVTPAPAQSLERVEITGSNIRRADAETSSPVQVITKQEIDQAGKATVAQYLQTLTADGQGSVPFTYGRGFNGATSGGISLRGLGANATLVLINGRRAATAVLADDAQRSFVDLNQIPIEAVERIEVLKDGASAIYGSDALAGVVNIILRKNFVGTVAKVTYGMSEKTDGKEPRAALTHGFGDLSKDGYNVLLNAEYGKRNSMKYRDRMDRDSVGVAAIGQPQWGFDPNLVTGNINRAGGQGTIPTNPDGSLVNNLTSTSITGNVRNPATLNYYNRANPGGVGFTRTFPAAATYCLDNANLPQNDRGGGCIIDYRQMFLEVQPEQESGSLYGRFTKQITPDTEGFVELSYYHTKSSVAAIPIAPSTAYFDTLGISHSQTAPTQLGAAHPDNPYFGTAARLSYLPLDIGEAGTDSTGHSLRFVAGARGTWNNFDFDTGVVYSEAKQTDTAKKVVNWRVKNALLNPTAANVADATAFSPAYAALPAGTVYRIAENAGLNSAAVYQAMLANQDREGESKMYSVDARVSREVMQLAGGALGVAAGAELRREENNLPFWNGEGDYSGLSLTRYGGARNIFATYVEVAAPVIKNVELIGALRYDHYTDAGSSWTPKAGVKWKVLDTVAVRGTYSKAFRAPSFAENGANSLASFGSSGTITDTARCTALRAAGVPEATVLATCTNNAPAFVITGNPNLQPEKATSETVGVVWDITPRSSVTADLWRIKRKGFVVTEDGQVAVDSGNVVRDPSQAIAAGDPGAILTVGTGYQNAANTLTEGLDVEMKHRMLLGENRGAVTAGLTWTHLFTQTTTFADGTVQSYAGTHGNCDITNCVGSPKDKLSITGAYEVGPWRVGANINYRGQMSNKLFQEEVGCDQQLANGADSPENCRIKHFVTLDLSGSWKFGKNAEVFGSIANLFDAKPPHDFQTYGAIGYNPLDYSGAIGRFYRLGMKYQF